jgi:hypothetical protein
MKSEYEGKFINPVGVSYSLLIICATCAEGKDFNNIFVQDKDFEAPRTNFKHLCGKMIPEKTKMWSIDITKEVVEDDVIQPEYCDSLRIYCEDCAEKKSLKNIIVPNK